jgi:phytanoyl-CoA hydroxylase
VRERRVSRDNVAELRGRGFTLVRGCVEASVLERLRAEAAALIARFGDGERGEDYWAYAVRGRPLPMLYRIHNLEKQGAATISDLFGGPAQGTLAAALLGGRARATVCAMVIKTRGVAEVPWHRDRDDTPPHTALNLSVYLDASQSDNGCFEAVPGSHLLPDGADAVTVRDRGPRVRVPADPGDVLAHDVRLVHGSGPNQDGAVRRSIITEFDSVLSA